MDQFVINIFHAFPETNSVVQTVCLSLPKLDHTRRNYVATPAIRKWNRVICTEFLLNFLFNFINLFAVLNDLFRKMFNCLDNTFMACVKNDVCYLKVYLRLRTCESTYLTCTRTTSEISFGLFTR